MSITIPIGTGGPSHFPSYRRRLTFKHAGRQRSERGLQRRSQERDQPGQQPRRQRPAAGWHPAAGRQCGYEQGDDLGREGRRCFSIDDAGPQQDRFRLPGH